MELSKNITIDMEKMPQMAEYPMSLIYNTINSVSNLFYETVLVIDMCTLNLWFLSLASGLSKRLSSFNLQDRSFPYLVETISGITSVELKVYLEAIVEHYKRTETTSKSGLVYMTDMPMLLNEGKSWATYRFSPLSEDIKGNPVHFIVAVSFATGYLEKKLMAMNQHDGKREIYNPMTSQWNEWKIPKLTAIEINVLALSAQGFSVNEIAQALHKAVDTIKSARKRIFRKFQVENITQAVLYALNNKVI